MGVFVAKQVVIMSHWGSVRDIARSVGLNGAYWHSVESVRLSGGSVGSLELSECQWGSVSVSGGQWDSLGLSGTQCAMYIHL